MFGAYLVGDLDRLDKRIACSSVLNGASISWLPFAVLVPFSQGEDSLLPSGRRARTLYDKPLGMRSAAETFDSALRSLGAVCCEGAQQSRPCWIG